MGFRVWVVVWSLLVSLMVRAETETVESILQRMTLEQKVAQLFVATYWGNPPNQAILELLRSWQVGAVALLPSNLGSPADITAVTNTLQQTVIAAGGVPLLLAVDQEGGIISHLEQGFTQFPVPALLAATNDPDLAYRVGQAIGAEMRAVGLNMNLAPVADVNTNPANPIIGRRSFGSDPQYIAPIIANVVRGLQDEGVLATAKHFPGHGDTDSDSHLTLPIVNHDMARLSRVEFVPFQATIEANVGAIMVAHIWYPAFDPQQIPASLSTNIVSGLLREGLGYNGIIVTDALDMDAIDTVYSPREAALLAIQAGHDLVILGAHVNPDTLMSAMQAVVDAVRAGQIDETRIDGSVRRVLDAKARLGVLGWQPLDPLGAQARIDAVNAAPLVDTLFTEGITLVKDESVLPLGDTVGFIYPATRPSLWEACRTDGWQPLGVSLSPSDDEIAWAVSVAERVDKVVVLTQNADENPRQQALVKALPADKTLVVALQSPYDLETFPQVGAYMVTYSPSLAGNRALCAILTGQATALGQLVVGISP